MIMLVELHFRVLDLLYLSLVQHICAFLDRQCQGAHHDILASVRVLDGIKFRYILPGSSDMCAEDYRYGGEDLCMDDEPVSWLVA